MSAERAQNWDYPGDQENAEPELLPHWADSDHPDDRLDAAYRSGIVPPDQRRIKP
jgi:hypothetical protein